MKRRFEFREFVVLTVAVLLFLVAPASAMDGQPLAVELANSTADNIGWIRIPDDPGLEPQQFTIEAWVTPLGEAYSGTGSPVGGRVVIKPMEGQVGNYLASYSLGLNTDNSVSASIAHQLKSSGTYVSSDGVVPAGVRSHIAMSFDGVWVKVFINGELDTEELAAGNSVDYGPEDVLIGAANLGSGYLRLFRGVVDDVRIWDYARNSTEISAQMGCSLVGDEPGLLAYYSFNLGDYGDDSGFAHHGSAEGTVELVISNDACLPFISTFENGDLSEWSSASSG